MRHKISDAAAYTVVWLVLVGLLVLIVYVMYEVD